MSCAILPKGLTDDSRLTPELIAECERVVSKTFPACVAFHKPSFVQQIKSTTLDPSLVFGLLTCAARTSPSLIRRYGNPTAAAENFATKAINLINQNLDHPSLADIQALCLLIIHEWGSRNAVRAYVYLGQAARMIHMYRILDVHQMTASDSDQFLRMESLRRTIWLIYILDCFLTSSPGRYPALTNSDLTNVALPCSDINFAFGNAVYVKTLHQHLELSRDDPNNTAEVGEFGHIVLAAMVWRETVDLLTRSFPDNYREDDCLAIISKIDALRASLPMQFRDKPGQINLHMTMGSGYTFAVLHCLLHCASVFAQRRRLLQDITSPTFNLEAFRQTPRCHEIIDRLFTSCHGINALLIAVEAGTEKDHNPCFPIFMLFSSFTASATIAYLSLKGLTPPNAVETAAGIVKDGLRFMQEGTESWPLMASWLRHLAVMQRVIDNDAAIVARHGSTPHAHVVKEELGSNADNNPDAMDYDGHHSGTARGPMSHTMSESGRSEGEQAVALPRRPGFAAINGASGGGSTPATTSPPPPNTGIPHHQTAQLQETKATSPGAPSNGVIPISTSQDMTGPELCQAFERQLLEMDDLAAFMGGGV